MKITIPELKKLCFQVFKKVGVSKKDGELIFAEYLDGELRGRASHGFAAFVKFGAKVANRKKGKPMIEKNKSAYTIINGKGNLGQVVCKDALDKTIKKAKKQGIALLGIYNMYSYLMPGTYARMAVKKDMIAIITNYGGNKRIAPFGSIDPFFGTNPLAIGIPASDYPLVLDMATSAIAMGKVRLAEKLNLLLPIGVAIDKYGKPTRDPKKAMNGAIYSFGGYRGSGLALAIEILTRIMFNLEGKVPKDAPRGYLFIIIDPKIFGNVTNFKKRVASYCRLIKKSRKAKGVKEIFLPGEQSEKIKQLNLKRGYLEIDKKIIDEIKAQISN